MSEMAPQHMQASASADSHKLSAVGRSVNDVLRFLESAHRELDQITEATFTVPVDWPTYTRLINMSYPKETVGDTLKRLISIADAVNRGGDDDQSEPRTSRGDE